MKTFPTRIAPLLLSLLLFSSLAEAQQLYEYTTESEVVVPKGRELYFYGMRSYPFGKIPQGARLKALGQIEKMSRFSDGVSILADESWKQLGPMTVGGRVRSIAVHPSDGKTLWIGAADGGVWKSTDRGNSWKPVMDNSNAIAMGAVAVAPSNPNILYAGTGEMSSNVDAYTGAGIFKSEDGGETWHVVGLTNVGAFSRIVIHPANPDVVWAGATKNNGGFYKSEDGGATWRKTFEEGISDITVNPSNPNEIWLALMGTGIRYSNDGGESFITRNTGITDSRYVLNRMSIQVAPSNPSILYVLSHEATGTTSSSLEYARIYKTTNGGQNWTKIYDGTGSSDFLKPSATSRSQGWYNNVIIVKPDDPDVVLAGGVRMIRTTNGGNTWPSIGGNVHPDHHALAFDPTNPNTLYNGNDGGMYRSDDGGTSLASINNGLPISQFYAMAVDQREPNLTYGGTQDNGTLTTESESFGDIFGGDGFHVTVDHENPNIVYVEREYGQMYRLDQFGVTAMYLTGDFSANSDVANWSAPLILDPHNSNRLYSGRDSLYLCVNPKADRGALQWLVVSPYMPGNISAMVISPHSGDVIFIGSSKGAVQRTTNGLQDWTDLSFGHGLPNRAVTDFIFSRNDPNTIYASYSGFFTEHVFKSTDLGETWTSISNGLPDIPINALEIHPDNEDIIFAGSDLGMFITLDGGETWAVYNEGMPRVGVIDLEVHMSSRTLRAATHGRSMFERGIGGDPIIAAPSITSPHGGENWIGGTQNVIAWGGFDGTGDPSGVTLEFSLDDGQTWRLLGKNIAGSTFRWNTVQASTITARVRVTGYTALSETPVTVTSNTFSIRPFSQGTVLTTDSKPTVPYGIASDGEYLWATDFQGNTLLKLDPNTLDAVEQIHLGAEAGDSLFTDITYYPPRNSFFLHRLNTTTVASAGGVLVEVNKQGEVLGVWNSPCGYPIGLAWLGETNPDLGFLVASDRDGAQNFYYYRPETFDPSSSDAVPIVTIERVKRVENGPRGMAADSGTFWQVITDFTGGTLQGASSYEYDIRDDTQAAICGVELSSSLASTINARGIEIDRRDKGLWITDFGGNLYKVASCYTLPGPSDSGTAVNLSVEAGPAIADGVTLQQNLPNPFANSTEITFTLPKPMRAQVLVHDLNGRLVATLADKVFQSGEQSVEFQPKGIPSGLYRYSLVLENGARISKTMVYLK
ncbi:MAG: hypothetical protein KDD67_08660 [Ignavibacteriae bacterium]|nr:hypothetical protein [Ignavibacteriota bacterium]MCB9216740.1 hypothetical protein [Ignavibacteria bacterium]